MAVRVSRLRKEKIGYIVVTADKGLAGAYNHNVIKATEELLKKPGKHKLFVLGEAGRQYFAKREGIEMDTSSVIPSRIRHYTDRESFLRKW